ncbi:NADP-dependent isocitrate dehydrogenase [Desulfuromonas acetoxidans]|uniref:Isocitrate dehydrogenase [NADP] n=1 Tax=Desulfuromonas acetoxidans (strain DSM 684 / 11070) TaxID=281689 RepID=Q1JVN1_DESA6|nr:NADP-dependent isocitrate dehydrogenase [Desulfuromonas acetoxidans]EAT14290.1 isocitrate dehydrogenase, NADP-dependent [Desulfuromonas acetoxidans DSM 684]MBF0647130.1 NADP-dependent isocitrate dehydrogenase [Desulfuromonas acetoxidans]NVD25057.1 NADP-dependent isocitrate dehydrogenase [Desulfuromonas acetoxidans]NVE17102.1 NADP-dependent isocitrate dehydrogenase [Desulfuromonas acetoxidans]
MSTIIWSEIDEAPALATYALLPIVQKFLKGSGVDVETRDISLSGRILANFPEKLKDEQKVADYLAQLGELTQDPSANIIKLPNVSASIPQLQAAIKELQEKGYDVPDYPEEPKTDEEKELQARYSKCLGSAVNPVLREGNSDRRSAASVKKFAQKNPHRMMKDWPADSKTRVAHMNANDFYASETSVTLDKDTTLTYKFVGNDGSEQVLKEKLPVLAGEVVDSSSMSMAAVREFFAQQIEEAKKDGVLLSLHMKATMMKISDPYIFGQCVKVFYKDVFEKYGSVFEEIGVNVSNGLGDVYAKLKRLPDAKREEIEAAIMDVYKDRPALAMVDSRRGITNLHAPNDVIIDASMPVVVRDGGRMWNLQDELQDTVAMIPDRCYATIYQTVIEDCQKNGQFDPATMGAVSNVGLMAKKAEEYGSHDKTFYSPGDGKIQVIDEATGAVLLEQTLEAGDVFRSCQTKDESIRDWVKLAVSRAKATGVPTVFWLDPKRGHDAQIIAKVETYLKDHDTTGLDIRIMTPDDAMQLACDRSRRGEDTVTCTGNALRDYLTDLFPILELGTSARMLSIVPLLQGGGVFETGAGGSAPKHVEQFLKEGHLRWDSLGEYCALVPSLEHIAKTTDNATAQLYAETLDAAVTDYLLNEKAPSRKVNEIDNRGSSFYVALYWAKALAAQDKNAELKAKFAKIAADLEANEAKINEELLAAQGSPVDIGGYYKPDVAKTSAAMRPSATLNAIIDAL